MTPDKYQQPRQPVLRSHKGEEGCPLEQRVSGIESDISAVKRMVTGVYEKVDEILETTDAIHDIVKYAGEPKYNHADDWDMLDTGE